MARITAALLIALLLTGTVAHIIGLSYAAGLLGQPWMVGALGAYGLTTTTFALMVVWTNVRRPRGSDPNALPPAAPSDASLMDSIGQLMEGAAKRPRRSARVPEELTREQE